VRDRHLLTFDIEDWYRGLLSGPHASDCHLETAMDLLLERLAACGAHATFFVLGDDAHRIQSHLQRCVREGHEVASHGMHHVRVDSMSPDTFRQDISDAFSRIEDITQEACRGYRAPWFSLNADMPWAFEQLAERGAVYDASFRLPLNTPPPPVCRDAGMVEVSVPTVPCGWAQYAVLSGLLFRLLPRSVTLALLRRCTRAGTPGCLYLHPYEWAAIDPPPSGPLMQMARRRLLVSHALPKLEWLASHVQLLSVSEWLEGADAH
jgi:hypothetical protein